MAIESGFQVRLGIYRIDPQTLALRGEIWAILAPRLEAILNEHFDNSLTHARFYTDNIEKNRSALIRRATLEIERLLHDDYDERWVENCYERAKFEVGLGFDMRSRGAMSMSLLVSLNKLVRARHPFSVRKVMDLMDAATRIFSLDTANAAACHNSLEVQQGKARAEHLHGAIQEFGQAIDGIRRAVDQGIEEFGSTSHQLAELARAAGSQAALAGRAADDSASKMTSIAAATEELSAALEEMHRQTAESAKLVNHAVSHSGQTTANIRRLAEAVEKIGSVIDIISKIAAQTNLLALNATIEAARAGEKGKGFAVVAFEVKSLATRTAEATADIARQINLIQESTRNSMGEIGSTIHSIAKISETADSIMACASQQAATTNEMARNTSGAAANAATVADALKTVGETVQRTEETTKLVLSFSTALAQRSAEIGKAMEALLSAASDVGARQFADLGATRR